MSPSCGPGSRPCGARRRPAIARGPTSDAAEGLLARAAIAREEFDQRREAERVAEALVNQALEEVSETRVSLGLPPHPESGDLAEVPADLNQTFSGVRQALAELIQGAAQVGLPLLSVAKTPKQAIEEFVARDKEGNIDRIYGTDRPRGPGGPPGRRQAGAGRARPRPGGAGPAATARSARRSTAWSTRRNVNPGNNVAAGQGLMAVRSLTEIWVDANFKETQLADLRIGQRADLEVDMYGSRKVFRGRITGFTMGTGQTLALLPPQNATGNFVKIVQRLPVRIELEDYDPEKETLFVGLSVTPYVFVKEPPQGPGAGRRLQELQRPNPSASK